LLRQLALRYAGTGRTVIAALAGVCGIFAAPRTWIASGIVVAVVAWSVVYATLLRGRRSPRWLLAGDVAVVAVACLTQRWTVPAEALSSNQGWVIALASITVVVYQWHTGLVEAIVAVFVVDGAFLAGVLLAAPVDLGAAPMMIGWLPVEAVLSRVLWILVRRGGRRADELTEQIERERRAEAVGAAARAEERSYLAALHDTAASTLLMVGLGGVRSSDDWLRAQAARDLATLRRSAAEDAEDLIPLLRAVIATSQVSVTADLPDSLTAPAPVCGAVCRSVHEALTNVARHAGTRFATVHAVRDNGFLAVRVVDDGAGFAPALVPAGRFGLSASIIARMEDVGGRAEVISAPGRGTTVRLEWPVS
jgi:signal transduction histidine kinase